MIEKLYKAFNENTTCLNFKYPTDGTWTPEIKAKMCMRGYHACRKLDDVLRYYSTPDSIWEIEGDVQDSDGDKVVCSTIRLIRKLEFKDIANTLDIIQPNTVGWFWEYFSPEIKERHLIRLSHSLYAVAQYARISEEDYEWFIEEVTSYHREQEPWFYEKVAECNPEKAWLFIRESPELLNQCREMIVWTADASSILGSNLKLLFSKKELKEMISLSSKIKISYMDAQWILDEISFTEDEFLNFWKKLHWKRAVYELITKMYGMYHKVINERYIMPFLKAGCYSVLNEHPYYCTDEFLETVSNRIDDVIIYKASPRARVKYFMRTFDTHIFNYAPALIFETVEEIETVNRFMKMKSRNETIAKTIARHPLTPKKIVKRIAKSKRWWYAARYARDRLAIENS